VEWKRVNSTFVRLALAALVVALTGACAQFRGIFGDSPGRYEQWAGLIDEVRAFERRIGFEDTGNFLHFAEDQESFTFCGYASRLYLPYSYEDPAIHWTESVTEQECRALGKSADVYFGAAEALGEIATPVTRSMLGAPLERFLYLVIHENCHDQFDFPAGIEEALCNVIAYRAMAAFGKEKFGPASREHRAITRYVSVESERSLLTRAFYRRLASLYARHARKELPAHALLRERDSVLRFAERVLSLDAGSLNIVNLATDMTYDRHYPLLVSVHDVLGSDLGRTVLFFKRVDALKPRRDRVMKQRGIDDDRSVEFIRAYEAAVVDTIRQELEAAN
jgi:hypothetical protein